MKTRNTLIALLTSAAIKDLGIEIRTKRNLDRILNPKKGTPCPSK